MIGKTRSYQVRAKTACEAVGLDRDRFNEEASMKIYPCAPPADAGRARVFYEPDLVALYFYAFLRRTGLPADRAAQFACRIGEQARHLSERGMEIAGDVVIGFDDTGTSLCGLGTDISATVDGTRNAFSGSGFKGDTLTPMVMCWRFALQNVLSLVKERVDELTAPKGED